MLSRLQAVITRLRLDGVNDEVLWEPLRLLEFYGKNEVEHGRSTGLTTDMVVKSLRCLQLAFTVSFLRMGQHAEAADESREDEPKQRKGKGGRRMRADDAEGGTTADHEFASPVSGKDR